MSSPTPVTDITANAPQQPSPQAEAQAWASTLPEVYQAQAQYMPQQAQEQQSIMQQLYPQLAQLPESLATQANQGMQSGMPSWKTQQYQSDMNAQLGQNAGAPIGADYASRGLMQQQQNYKQYYQQMAQGLTGLQGVANPSLNYMQGYSPNSVMQGMNQAYGTAGNIYGSQLGYNSQQNQNMMNLIGTAVTATGSMLKPSAPMPIPGP